MTNTNEQLEFGDIILITFPTSKPVRIKKSPCMVLQGKGEDVLVSLISSRLENKNDKDILLKKDKKNHLAADSVLKTNKIMPIHRNLVYKKLGKLNPADKKVVKEGLVGLMKAL